MICRVDVWSCALGVLWQFSVDQQQSLKCDNEPAIEVLAREIAQARQEGSQTMPERPPVESQFNVWIEHPHTRRSRHFHPCAHTTCLHKTCSSTCHHMSERLLFPCFVFFLCLSCLYFLSHFYLFSVLNFNLDDVENAEH